ncbi:hypothetical protein [Massilia scottii]|uniref:hypothetical protein n=1 Tax=Massilia scottii TaxID=3057166 RepID=UPI00279697A9|nr:hypothetical protein [Massilia sp. CCM 9029]MDQ1834287.1 hypothetical protein [Massilia sp. CCM 9029]
MPSPEHEFIVSELHNALARHAGTALFGIAEAERKKFDYGCLLNRDLSRPLVAQVLWAHPEGIDKDLRTLIHDDEAILKLYLVRHSTRNLMRFDEVVQSYRRDTTLSRKLAGLRHIPIPADFDADQASHRAWLADHLDARLQSDVLFGIVFGRLTARDVATFHRHGGPIGLKVAILDAISSHGLVTHSELKERINYGTTGPIREVIAMLTGAGFIAPLGDSVLCMPTPKGRSLLDVIRKLYFEWSQQEGWSSETALLLRALGITDVAFPKLLKLTAESAGFVEQLLVSCVYSEKVFNACLLAGIDAGNPTFYADFPYDYFLQRFAGTPHTNENMFDDPDALFFPGKTNKT